MVHRNFDQPIEHQKFETNCKIACGCHENSNIFPFFPQRHIDKDRDHDAAGYAKHQWKDPYLQRVHKTHD